MSKPLIRPYASAQDPKNPTDTVVMLAIQHKSPAIVAATVDYIMEIVAPMIESQLPIIEQFEAKVKPLIDELAGKTPSKPAVPPPAPKFEAATRDSTMENGGSMTDAADALAAIMRGANPGAGKLQ